MTYLVSFTSPTEGVTIGATGDTMVEALAKLAEEFGEGITVLYEHTHHQLSQQAEAVQAAASPRDVEQEGERQSLAVFRGDDDTGSDVPDDPAAASGGSDPAAGEEAGGDEADGGTDRGGGGSSDQTCAICGADVTDDRAIASKITVGEVRCSDCAA